MGYRQSHFFGTYEQDMDSGNGQEPIEWIVLDQKDDKVLLLSAKDLDASHFYKGVYDAEWEISQLREGQGNVQDMKMSTCAEVAAHYYANPDQIISIMHKQFRNEAVYPEVYTQTLQNISITRQWIDLLPIPTSSTTWMGTAP